MTRMTVALALALAASAAAADAAPAMTAMPGMKTAPPAASQTGKGVGVVTEVDRKAGTLTIKHGPIAAFKWPAMTMTFHAQPASLLNGVTAGQKISFDATLFNGAPQVTAIRKQKGGRRRCPNGCAPAHAAA